MVEDEAKSMELRLGRTREEYKTRALWEMQGGGEVLKIEKLFSSVAFVG
jgi:hypothetical protein